VHYVGQPVALIVAESVLAAQDAAEKLHSTTRTCRRQWALTTRPAPGATQIHPEAPGNIAFEYESGHAAAVDAAFCARGVCEPHDHEQPAPDRQPDRAARLHRRLRRPQAASLRVCAEPDNSLLLFLFSL